MHFSDFKPSALSGDDLDREFLEHMLRDLGHQRDFLVDDLTRRCESWARSFGDHAEVLKRGMRHHGEGSEFVGNIAGLDAEYIQLSIIDSIIAHIRKFLYPEKVAQELAERKAKNLASRDKRDAEFRENVRPKKKSPKKKAAVKKTGKGKK